MKLHSARFVLHKRRPHHHGCRHSGGFRALFAHLNLGFLQHLRYEYVARSEVSEVGNARLEHRGCAELAYYVVERQFHLCRKARQFQVNNAFVHALADACQPFCVERPHHFRYGFALVGQQNGHIVTAVAVGQLYCGVRFVVHIHEFLLLVHHLHTLDVTGIALKTLLFRVLLVEFLRPSAVEVDGVHQVSHRICLHFLHYLRYHALCLPVAPCVNVLYGILGGEVEALHFGLVAVSDGACELLSWCVALVYRHIIGHVHHR